jgi:hypothetical protein
VSIASLARYRESLVAFARSMPARVAAAGAPLRAVEGGRA